MNSSGQTVPQRRGSQELFVTEMIRVRRQAGYVYNKPSVSFDLPTRAPSVTATTQAPTVDRTQAQMMYYAYPVPAAGGNAGNNGASSGPTTGIGGGSMATASAGISRGYGASNAGQARPQFSPTSSFQTGSVQSSSGGSSGYDYSAQSVLNGPVTTGSAQQSNNAGSSGYGYNAPSAGGAQVSNNVESTQTSNSGSSQSGSTAGSGYEYNSPTNSESSGVAPAIDVSTNAPKYLPPSSGGSSNNILSSPVLNQGETSGAVSGSLATVTQPLDQYLPPLISNPAAPAATVTDQYLPPNRQLDSPASLSSSNPSVNKEVQGYSGTGPSSNYIPPNLGESPLPVTNVTPRPFSPAPLSDGYLPPYSNSQPSAPNIPSTPASPYLPPVL